MDNALVAHAKIKVKNVEVLYIQKKITLAAAYDLINIRTHFI